ncbi:hypothetical protein [Alkalicoccobacillus murimartini]|uniref:Lipoprotein n=1 Tax=Alkalicoccobacillus murimartini TaxID=171685 RepID=A0ABT9YKM7_9BACI|nr:hypothetical protein [Alkalicoccobacillus murimartini]MDQ0208403.1 hypothetical protein [Alkalicoccobacillus murimartini]
MKKILSILTLLLILNGCHFFNKELPREKPDDFAFSLKYGVTLGNELNAYNDTYTKDLVSDGKATTDMELSNEELVMIYEEFREVDLFTLSSEAGSGCSEPNDKYELSMTADGEEYHLFWSTACDTEKVHEWQEAMNFLYTELIYQREEYQKLPEANGGYE